MSVAISSVSALNPSSLSNASLNAKARIDRIFAKLDTNKDGYINKSEFQDFAKTVGVDAQGASAVFDSIDTNGDGKISKDEVQSFLTKFEASLRGQQQNKPGDSNNNPAQNVSDINASLTAQISDKISINYSQYSGKSGKNYSASSTNGDYSSQQPSQSFNLNEDLKASISGEIDGQQFNLDASLSIQERINVYA